MTLVVYSLCLLTARILLSGISKQTTRDNEESTHVFNYIQEQTVIKVHRFPPAVS